MLTLLVDMIEVPLTLFVTVFVRCLEIFGEVYVMRLFRPLRMVRLAVLVTLTILCYLSLPVADAEIQSPVIESPASPGPATPVTPTVENPADVPVDL